MNLPYRVRGKYGELSIARATEGDLPDLLKLFDEAVAWLVEKGITGQWGTRPFSEMPSMVARFRGWIEDGTLFVGRIEGEIVGTVVLAEKIPQYALKTLPEFPDPAFYLEAFSTARSMAGQGVGGELLRWAETYAQEKGKAGIWLDCYADNHQLVEYYRRQGFAEISQFFVGGWRGMLFYKGIE